MASEITVAREGGVNPLNSLSRSENKRILQVANEGRARNGMQPLTLQQSLQIERGGNTPEGVSSDLLRRARRAFEANTQNVRRGGRNRTKEIMRAYNNEWSRAAQMFGTENMVRAGYNPSVRAFQQIFEGARTESAYARRRRRR